MIYVVKNNTETIDFEDFINRPKKPYVKNYYQINKLKKQKNRDTGRLGFCYT